MRYRVMLGCGMLMAAVGMFAVKANEARRAIRIMSPEEAAARWGGEGGGGVVNDQCVAPDGAVCLKDCKLVGDQCLSCVGSVFTGCVKNKGLICDVEYDNEKKLYCGVEYSGKPNAQGECETKLCDTKTTTKCFIIPNKVKGSNCPP